MDSQLRVLRTKREGQRLNLVNAGRRDWYEGNCPLCDRKDSVEHAFTQCSEIKNFKHALASSLDTNLDIPERVQAVRDVITVDNLRNPNNACPPGITNNVEDLAACPPCCTQPSSFRKKPTVRESMQLLHDNVT